MQIAVVLLVAIVFQAVENHQVAGVIAGILFIGIPTYILIDHYRHTRSLEGPLILAIGLFEAAFAFPMLFMRVKHWGEDFATLTIWGISGELFHSISTWGYLLMVIATIYEMVRIWGVRSENE
jgi:hypothetical protein